MSAAASVRLLAPLPAGDPPAAAAPIAEEDNRMERGGGGDDDDDDDDDDDGSEEEEDEAEVRRPARRQIFGISVSNTFAFCFGVREGMLMLVGVQTLSAVFWVYVRTRTTSHLSLSLSAVLAVTP